MKQSSDKKKCGGLLQIEIKLMSPKRVYFGYGDLHLEDQAYFAWTTSVLKKVFTAETQN